jgi:hypothetical protein
MKWYNNYICFGLLLVLMSSNHAMSKRPKDKPVDEEQGKYTTSSVVVAANDKESRTEAAVTFLDTLNRGREISIADKDLSQVIPESTDASTQTANDAGIDGFRIQCLASSQIEKIRSEQKLLEGKIKYSVYIIFNAPYYKLLIGDFVKRGDADIVTAKLKEMGYSDAWVIRSKINPSRQ